MFGTLGISLSKRDGPTTYQSFFIYANAPNWSFFSFDTRFEPKVIKKENVSE